MRRSRQLRADEWIPLGRCVAEVPLRQPRPGTSRTQDFPRELLRPFLHPTLLGIHRAHRQGPEIVGTPPPGQESSHFKHTQNPPHHAQRSSTTVASLHVIRLSGLPDRSPSILPTVVAFSCRTSQPLPIVQAKRTSVHHAVFNDTESIPSSTSCHPSNIVGIQC